MSYFHTNTYETANAKFKKDSIQLREIKRTNKNAITHKTL